MLRPLASSAAPAAYARSLLLRSAPRSAAAVAQRPPLSISAYPFARRRPPAAFFSTTGSSDGGGDCAPCSAGQCLDKLAGIMWEYRKANYAQTVPSRYIKEVVSAIDTAKNDVISIDEMMDFLDRIGASGKMTKEEIDTVLTEMGITGDKREIPVKNVMEVMKSRIKERTEKERKRNREEIERMEAERKA
uniref:EF-hand domain-containing protein n=1 Tax=Trieres chinensis TaxID=1514140 RepID=A0A7S2AAQ9_TRICV|mmetsp:Transcript_9594/g.20337  ORF Transcript_9594/g.20337 Transcript_9594/m.20337 type:complete len:190 (+) Transcript_9594:85-654(+)